MQSFPLELQKNKLMSLDMFDFIRELYASSRQTALERVRSPVLGAFVFSWLGFNWQLLILLVRSKNPIEKTLEKINEQFGIEFLLIGPICTTALICFLLPRINKLVTKLQDSPNEETITINLSSKIKIAELQQEIADIEARKKLAEKKEERFIEDGIHNIIAERDRLKIIEKERNAEISEGKEKENQLAIEVGKLKAEIMLGLKENEKKDITINQLMADVKQKNEERDGLFKERLELISKQKNLTEKFEKLQIIIEENEKTLEITNTIEKQLVENYPNIFSRIPLKDNKLGFAYMPDILKDANERANRPSDSELLRGIKNFEIKR